MAEQNRVIYPIIIAVKVCCPFSIDPNLRIEEFSKHGNKKSHLSNKVAFLLQFRRSRTYNPLHSISVSLTSFIRSTPSMGE